MPCDTLIVGDLVLPDRVLRGGGLAITDGIISSIHAPDDLPEARRTIDHSGHYVLPGGIDAHVHAYSSSSNQEGIARLTEGAAKGGITTVIEMPYDRPEAITTAEHLKRKIEVVEREAVVDVALFATIKKHDGWREIPALAAAGACAFKLSTYETDPDRFPEIPDRELMHAFREINKTGLVVAFHAENGNIIDPLVEEWRPQGEERPEAHSLSRPPEAETTSVAKLLELARTHPVKLHIVHLSVPLGYELIEWYKAQGVDVTAETCLHFLVLSQEQMPELRGFGKMNPPLRPASMMAELWDEVRRGRVDFVTSDHAPWTEDLKTRANIFDNMSGIPGVEILLPLLFSEAVSERDLAVTHFADLIATGPARRYGLYPQKGALTPGGDADVCVVDPEASWSFDASQQASVAKWSPFDGMTLKGKVVRTFVRGREVFDGSSVLAEPGTGSFVRPVANSD